MFYHDESGKNVYLNSQLVFHFHYNLCRKTTKIEGTEEIDSNTSTKDEGGIFSEQLREVSLSVLCESW